MARLSLRYERQLQAERVFFMFNPSSGGTGRLTRHERRHSSAAVRTAHFSKSPPSTSMSFIANAAAYAVSLDLRPISFADGQNWMKLFLEAIFRTGQTVPIADTIDPKCFMPCAKTMRKAIADKAADNRGELRNGAMDDLLKLEVPLPLTQSR